MTDQELNLKDIEVLLEAMDVWETKDNTNYMISGLFDMVIMKDEDLNAYKAKREKESLEYDQKVAERKEVSYFIKYKLMIMKRLMHDQAINNMINKANEDSTSSSESSE